jgi:hypothetical protein
LRPPFDAAFTVIVPFATSSFPARSLALNPTE